MSLPLPRVETDGLDGPSDADLIADVRAGDAEAYGLLYRRHAAAAYNLARQLTRSMAERDDLVAEAFAKVLDTLRGGGGPDVAFRAYLLTTLRNTLYDRARRDKRLELSDDMTRHDPGVPWVDTAVAGLESTLAARAFARLPERWQTVLWHTEVEQETPAQLAPVLGLTPNGVAALAYRAREGLRQAYLQEHLSDTEAEQCGHTVERLGAWARGGLSGRDRARVDAHLATCDRCRVLAAELEDVNASLRGLIAPIVLGTGTLLTAYLAATTETAAAAAAAGAGGAAAGAAGTGAAGAAVEAAGAGGAAAEAAGAGAAGAGAGAAGAGAGSAGGAAAGAAGTGAAGAAAEAAGAASAAGGAAAGAGSAAAGAGAAGAGGAAAGAGSAAAGAGSAAAGTAAAAGAGAGTAAGGSVLGSAAGWVIGTQVGQASAAAVAAVVIGGAAVVGLNTGPGSESRAAAPTSSATAGLPAPAEAAPGTSASPGATGAPGAPGAPAPGSPGAAGSPGPAGSTNGPAGTGNPGNPNAPGQPSRPATPGQPGANPGNPGGPANPGGGPANPGGGPGNPGGPAGAPGPPTLEVGSPAPVRPLRSGQPGEISVPVRNTGSGPATGLVAVIELPPGFTVRAGGSNDPANWACTGSADVATCRVSELPAGAQGTVRIKVRLAAATTAGPVSGQLTATDADPLPIPTTTIPVD